MSTTMMPFLYHTKTLSGSGWVRSTATNLKHGRVSRKREFMLSMSMRHSVNRNTIPTTSSNTKSGGGLVIRRTTNMSGSEPPPAGSWAYDSELRAFTEDKSKTKERPLIRKFMYNAEAHRSRETEFDLPTSIEFEDEPMNEDIYSGKDEIYQLTDTRGKRESTITPSERHAFQKIFSDIFQRNEKSSSQQNASLSPWEHELATLESEGVRNANVRPEKTKSNLADIVGGAIAMTREKKEEAVNRYPVALRPAAARAIGLDKETAESYVEDIIDDTQSAVEAEKMEVLREPERLRIEGMMKAAGTDFELWDIMEREVFSLIPKMGLVESPTVNEDVTPPTPKKKARKSKKRSKQSDVEKHPKESLVVSPLNVQGDTDAVPALSLYGPLYPSYILLGLRLLDRSFARPSPLALSLLPKIKSMGFISHVLGASTQFYNELMRIYRYRYDDFDGIITLLSEMDNAALEMDEETFDVVGDIVRTQRSVKRGDKGEAIKALWRLSEFAPGRFQYWSEKIEQTLSAKKLASASRDGQNFAR